MREIGLEYVRFITRVRATNCLPEAKYWFLVAEG